MHGPYEGFMKVLWRLYEGFMKVLWKPYEGFMKAYARGGKG